MYQNQVVPPQLANQFVKPKGYASEYCQWVINPMGQQTSFTSDEIIRFEMNLNTGYFDPWRSYFQIIVETDIPTGSMQVDSSAFSFISQSLITSITNANELQRVPQYDQIGNILVSTGYQPVFAVGKEYQGLGRSFYTNSTKAPTSATSNANNSLMVVGNAGQYFSSFADYGGSTFNPVFINGQQSTIGSQDVGFLSTNANITKTKGLFSKYQNVKITDGSQPLGPASVTGNVPSILSQLNNGLFLPSVYNQARAIRNGVFPPRIQYSLASLQTKYVDTSQSILRNIIYGVIPGISDFVPNSPNIKYQITYAQTITIKYYDLSNTQTPQGQLFTVQNTCGLHGYMNPYSPQLSIGLQQPFISPTVPQCGMKNGKILPQWQCVSQKRFISPLISSVMGVLIPQNSYNLMPVQAFKVYLQLTLNKFAMFSSGFNDRGPYDSSGMQYPIQRRFYFKKFNYNLQLYYFSDPEIKQYLASSLLKGISFSTQPVMLVSNYTVPNQLALRGTWQINTPSTFLTQLIIKFIDNRYLRYPYLRKNYALSCNISSFQIKFDTKWFPPQPIVGNAGNPQYLDSSGNVQPFLEMLLRTKDQLFTRQPNGIVNAINFAINSRVFDPTDTRTFLPDVSKLENQYSSCTINSQSQINTSTALGAPSFHQNRACGRALYVYNFENQGHSKGFANGLRIGSSRPFQLILNTTVDDPFMSQIGFYIFTRSLSIVSMGPRGVRVDDYR